MPNDDPPYVATTMAEAVRDMARQLERDSQHADAERTKLRAEVNAIIDQKWGEAIGSIEAMRKDVHVAIASIQIRAMQHEDSHTIDKHERISRQLILSLALGALIALGVLNLILSLMR